MAEARTRLHTGHVLNTMGHGGVPRVAYELLRRLPDDCTRTLYCLSGRTRDADARDRLVAELRAAGIAVRTADADGAAAAGAQVARWTVQDGIDVVHTHSTKPNRYARAAVLEHGHARVVAHYHNTYDDKWADPRALAVERELARASDALVAVSGAVRAHLVDRLGVPGDRVEVIANGVDVAALRGADGGALRAELGLAEDVPLIGTIGRISRQKAQGDLLRAARLVRERCPGAVLLVVGETDDPRLSQELHELARELGLGGSVRFLGYRPDVREVLGALDVFVLPSHWEGFGLVLVEAMAAGTPVVATDVGGVPEVTGAGSRDGGCALLVPPGRPDALAEGVLRLLADPALARGLVARGRRRALDFDWQDAADALHRLYARLLTVPVTVPGAVPAAASGGAR